MISYKINGNLAKLNEHDNANRVNRFAGAALKKKMNELVSSQVEGKPIVERPCRIKFTWYYSGRHDFDNIRIWSK